jgi:cytochrome c oxidase cbb3-type subunit IV
MSDYESWASFAQTWGTVSFVAFFVLVLLYALNPRKRDQFDQAAHIPLEKD